MSEHCPTCGTDLSEYKPVKPTHSLQEWFDANAASEFKGTLLTVEEACEKIGWPFQNKPECCGVPVEIRSLLGDAYHAECKKCGKWIHDVTVQFGNSWVSFPPDTVERDTQKRWIARAA